jgi:hypothetical protein
VLLHILALALHLGHLLLVLFHNLGVGLEELEQLLLLLRLLLERTRVFGEGIHCLNIVRHYNNG